MDQGETQAIARAFAWIFLASVLLGGSSPLTPLAKAINTTPVKK